MSIFQSRSSETTALRSTDLPLLPAPSRPIIPPPPPVNEARATSTRIGDRAKASETDPISKRGLIGAGSRIKGVLHFENYAQIDGHVEGEIRSEDTIVIGDRGAVVAQITAKSVVVAGEVKGDIVAVDRIELRDSARVVGNVSSPTVVVQDGAWFEGHCVTEKEDRSESKVTAVPDTRPASSLAADERKRWFGFSRKHA